MFLKIIFFRSHLAQYGSGIASTLFALKVTGDVSEMVQKIDLMDRLNRRHIATPEEYENVSQFLLQNRAERILTECCLGMCTQAEGLWFQELPAHRRHCLTSRWDILLGEHRRRIPKNVCCQELRKTSMALDWHGTARAEVPDGL